MKAAIKFIMTLTGLLLIAWLAGRYPAWATMAWIAGFEFLFLKVLTLAGHGRGVSRGKIAAYMLLWPGMKAADFLRIAEVGGRLNTPRPTMLEGMAVIGKTAFGLILMTWAIRHATDPRVMLVGWVGMLGLIFTLHFGLLHGMSWAWRRAGVEAAPIMRAPIAATSLAELWGERWNVALKETLLPAQDEEGSWRPLDVYSKYAGDEDEERTYSTAMCVLSLEVYYRYFSPLLKVR